MKTIIQFKSIESFATDRLIACKITADDLDKIIAIHTNEQVMANLGGVRGAEESDKNLESNLNRWQENGFGCWMFYLKSTNEWIGQGGLWSVEVAGNNEIEIGYALIPNFWQQGFGTEIARACTEIAFEVLRLADIVCFTETTNLSSRRIMQKVGFQYEKDFEYEGVPHVLYRMKNPRQIEVVLYDPIWPDLFARESLRIQNVLGSELSEIYHIGSTSIPNMSAKPVIDMLLVCENLDSINIIADKLSCLNYNNIRRQIIPHKSFFARKEEQKISYHLHLHERGSPQINRHVNFKDFVICNSEYAHAYSTLKRALASKHSNDRTAYVVGKDKLVQEIDTKAKLWDGRKQDYLTPNVGPLAQEWSQEKIIKAMVANLNVHMTHFSQYLNPVDLIRIPGFTIVNSGLSDDTFNYVLDADFSRNDADEKIQEVTNYFLQKNIPFSWWVSPHDKPDDLSIRLENHGYVNTENNTGMYFDLDAWSGNIIPIPELEIIQAKDEMKLNDFALVLANDAAAFTKYFSMVANILTDDDPIEYYVGYVNGKPVVRGLSCYFAQVAGLHWLSTAPSERRKGYGEAMQAFRLKRAKELGYHLAVLQASDSGYPLYKKLGYQQCGIFREFKLKSYR